MEQHEGYVHLKEYFEKIIDLRFSKAEGDLKNLEREVERRLQDLVNSRLKWVTILATLAVIISAVTLIMKLAN